MIRLQACVLFLLLLANVSDVFAGQAKTGRLTGSLAHKDGKPLANGIIYLFKETVGPPPAPEKYWRVPDEIAKLDATGRFSVELVSGNYYIGAIKRKSDSDVGPPQAGDYFLTSRDAAGNAVVYSIKGGDVKDIGTLAEAIPLDPAIVQTSGKGITAIAGRIMGEDGNPIVGGLVFAFTTPTATGKPLFASERSSAEGKFLIRVHEGGTYYLKVRDGYGGGPPKSTSVLDGVREEPLAEVPVATGEIATGVIHKWLTKRGPGSKAKTLDAVEKAATEKKAGSQGN